MLEVPAAAVSIHNLLDEVDFVSIGSNDLVQYLMAADRDNPKVSHLCQPLSPAVLQVLAGTIRACREAHKPVTLCGEMAGSPRAFVLLFGMGLRSFSMSPAFIPTIKELTSHLTRPPGRTDREACVGDQNDRRRTAIHGGPNRRNRAQSQIARYDLIDRPIHAPTRPDGRPRLGAGVQATAAGLIPRGDKPILIG